jgi:hypothetical protein
LNATKARNNEEDVAHQGLSIKSFFSGSKVYFCGLNPLQRCKRSNVASMPIMGPFFFIANIPYSEHEGLNEHLLLSWEEMANL